MYLAEKTQIHARYYNPQTGRFLSEDPIGFEGKDFNLYRYVQNNPTNMTDPSGKLPIPPIACLAHSGCPVTRTKCLFFSGLLVDEEEQIEWSRQCEAEKAERDIEPIFPEENVGSLGGSCGSEGFIQNPLSNL